MIPATTDKTKRLNGDSKTGNIHDGTARTESGHPEPGDSDDRHHDQEMAEPEWDRSAILQEHGIVSLNRATAREMEAAQARREKEGNQSPGSNGADQGPPQGLLDILEQLKQQAEHNEDFVTIDEILDSFNGRLFGPLLIIPGLCIVVPFIGGVPTLPTTLGVFVAIVAVQALFGSEHPWLPKWIRDRGIPKERLLRGMRWFRPWARWIDKLTAPRLQYLVTGVMRRVTAACVILLAMTLPPLELLPMACAVPGAAIGLFGLSLTAKDGLLALGGMLTTLGAVYLVVAHVIL